VRYIIPVTVFLLDRISIITCESFIDSRSIIIILLVVVLLLNIIVVSLFVTVISCESIIFSSIYDIVVYYLYLFSFY
jgi:hypothetical protein